MFKDMKRETNLFVYSFRTDKISDEYHPLLFDNGQSKKQSRIHCSDESLL